MSEQYALWGDEPTGDQRKEEGMEKALSKRGIEEWEESAKRWLWNLPGLERFTVDRLVDAVGLPVGEESAGRNNAVGALIGKMAKKGVIRNTNDYTKAKRPSSHSRVIAVWERTLLGKEPNVRISDSPVPVPSDASPPCPNGHADCDPVTCPICEQP